jgi:hypothetical protein
LGVVSVLLRHLWLILVPLFSLWWLPLQLCTKTKYKDAW